jgi:hypothetical protein
MFDSIAVARGPSLVTFQFLKTLPNLQVLDIGNLPLAYLSQFISSIRHTPLLELVLGNAWGPLEGPPMAGLAGLRKLSIRWYAYDNPNELGDLSGNLLAHLYELIRPTFATLVELRIDNMLGLGDFDLQILRPSADSLRTFECTLQSLDESILDTIPTILPHLTKLSIKWDNVFTWRSIFWKACTISFYFSLDINEFLQDAHIRALSRNVNLTDLELSFDFEMNARDPPIAYDDYACLVRCYKRRLKATQDIVSVCPRLQRCSWVQMGRGHRDMSHSFVVEERTTGGNLSRVVRGIKQGWMGRDHNTQYRGGSIVKCRLEDLPGDIIGLNDVE